MIEHLWKRKTAFLLVTVFISICIFLLFIYRLLDNRAVSSLVIPERFDEINFNYYVINKTTTSDQEQYFNLIYVREASTSLRILNPNISEHEKDVLRKQLYIIGYYTDTSSLDRDIETHEKLLLNGYLGQFFRFKLLGNINWLIFIVSVYATLTILKRKRFEWVVLTFYILATMLIIKGGFNYRYQLTLLPLTIVIILYFIIDVTQKHDIKKYRFLILSMLVFLSAVNTIKTALSISTRLSNMEQGVSSTKPGSDKTFEDMNTYINTLPIDSNNKVLVNNTPEYFYYNDNPGVYCWFNDGACYGSKGWEDVLNVENSSLLSHVIRNQLKCKYILSTATFNAYNTRIKQYLENDSILIHQSGDYLLYEIR
jgi:hypothetical protein